jgi:hypothetical protein
MSVNKQHKDTVFRLLFGEPDILREVYSAIEGVELPPETEIKPNALEGVLYRRRLNDISFEVGGKLVVLIEHQSTINPNMPLRMLMYIAELYDEMIGDGNIYGREKIMLSRPEFIVLYNGVAPQKDEQILKLSDSFKDAASLGIRNETVLELIVKVYNINEGHNESRLNASPTLDGYSAFIAKVRECEAEIAQGRPRAGLSEVEQIQAMSRAVEWCIANNILKGFMSEHRREVVKMLYEEWDMDTALAVERKEGREEGWQNSKYEDARNGLTKGYPVNVIADITGLDTATIQQIGLDFSCRIR